MVSVPGRFNDRVVLLTAAGSGIGAATARRLIAEGATALVTDLSEAAASQVAKESAAGDRVRSRALDVTDPEAWGPAVTELLGWTGRLDVLTLNAGLNKAEPLHSISDDLWQWQVDLTLTSALYGLRTCLPELQRTKGNAVLTSSIHAEFGLRGFPAYAAAKGGLNALARQLAVEYGPDVRINAVQPGAIETALWDEAPDEARHHTVAQTPAARMGTPEDVAAAVAFLASDDAGFLTGVSLPVDGGRSIALI